MRVTCQAMKEFDGDGQITKIAWSGKELKNGNLDRLGDMLKKKMQRLLVLDLSENRALKGACLCAPAWWFST